jgi:hypothetical protein
MRIMNTAEIVADVDPQETKEWLEALNSVFAAEGSTRAHYLLEKLVDKARRNGVHIPFTANTPYLNTIPPHQQFRARTQDPFAGALECDGDGGSGQPGISWNRRSYCELCVDRNLV